MAKTLKQMLELYEPKAEDEKNFVKKHIVAKKADANGNGDDVFTGSNVKTVNRKKEHHGYDKDEDGKVYEEVEVVDEKLAADATAGDYIKDFQKSKAPQFAGKSKEKRRIMGIAAYLQAKKGMKEEVELEEGIQQKLRKYVPGYAKRQIDQKMDAEKFGKKDVDKDANYWRYKKVQDKLNKEEVEIQEEVQIEELEEDVDVTLLELYAQLDEQNQQIMVQMIEEGRKDELYQFLDAIEE